MAKAKKDSLRILPVLQLLSKHELGYAPLNNERASLTYMEKPLLSVEAAAIAHLQKEGLVLMRAQKLGITEEGRAYLARSLRQNDAYLAQQMPMQGGRIRNDAGVLEHVTLHMKESPLAWLRTRKDKNGEAMLSETQFAAGEKLRSDFTRAQLNPRMTSSWDPSAGSRQRGMPPTHNFSDNTLAAKERVNTALKTVGPELSGVLLDVCCFLKGLTLVETERRWPSRTAKVVLMLALDRLAQHYGLGPQARGCNKTGVRSWGAEDYRPVILY